MVDYSVIPIYIGIDPQPKLMAVHVMNGQGEETLGWEIFYFQRRNKFEDSLSWQEATAQGCWDAMSKILDKYIHAFNSKTMWKKREIKCVTIEQQRGRLSMAIENSLLCWCMFCYPCTRLILHPNSWKKWVKMNRTGSNKDNKELSVKMEGDKVREWYRKENKELPKEENGRERIHDLCDAKLINMAGFFKLQYDKAVQVSEEKERELYLLKKQGKTKLQYSPCSSSNSLSTDEDDEYNDNTEMSITTST